MILALVLASYGFEAWQLEAMPTSWSQNNVLEQLMMPAVFSTIEMGALSRPDLVKLSVYGDSNTQTRHFLSGHDMTDPLHAGSPVLRVPFLAMSRFGLDFSESPETLASGTSTELLTDAPRLRMSGRTVVPGLGGVSPGAVELTTILSGPHPLTIDPPPPPVRRGFEHDTAMSVLGKAGEWFYAAELDVGSRRFLKNDAVAYTGSYSEPYALVSAVAQRRGLTLGVDYSFRNNQNAEFFFQQPQTFARHSLAAFAGYAQEFWKVSAIAKLEHDAADGLDFVHEKHDLDGQGLFPYTPRGTRFALSSDATYERPLYDVTKWFVHGRESAVFFAPSVRQWSNALTLDGVRYGQWDFYSSPSAYMYGQVEAGFRDRRLLGQFELAYALYAAGTHANALFQMDVGVKAQVQWKYTTWFMPFFAVSRTPVPLQQNVAEFLDPNILRGRTPWDRIGDTLDVTTSLAMTQTHTASLGFETRLGKFWRFHAMGIAKSFDNTLWTSFASASPTYQLDNHAFNTPGDKRYVLGNFSENEQPYYLGAHFQLTGSDPERFFLTLGGSTYYSLGTTAFGFGPLANDMGVVDYSQASPNAIRFPQGNLEGDRAYFVKLGFGLRIIHTLWASLAIRYRDGRPFTYFDWRADQGQIQGAYVEPKGSLYALSGPREGGRVNLDLKVAYTLPLREVALKLSLVMTNVYDTAAPISERQIPSGQSIRSGLELEPQRSLFVMAEMLFPATL